MAAAKRQDVIIQEIKKAGYQVQIVPAKKAPVEGIDFYKVSEKFEGEWKLLGYFTFRGIVDFSCKLDPEE